MNQEETKAYLERSIQSIIDDYELFGSILNRHASRGEVEQYMSEHDAAHLDVDADALNAMDYSETARDSVCGTLESSVLETMQEYHLSVADSHIWFTLGGPNISANVTGWSVNTEGSHQWVDVRDITLKGRWGGASVDVELFDTMFTGFAFTQIAELFELNLLSKFGAY